MGQPLGPIVWQPLNIRTLNKSGPYNIVGYKGAIIFELSSVAKVKGIN